jgi:uncharacterized membrane protein
VGTQPPFSEDEPENEVSGVILIEPKPIARAEQKTSVLVEIDDEWLERLDLPAD